MNQNAHLIVGGGPIGLYLASKLPEATVVDNKRGPGKKVSCAGLVTDTIHAFLSKKELQGIRLNMPKRTVIQGPTERCEVRQKHNHVIDNTAFENTLYDKALSRGADLRFSTQYTGSSGTHHHIKDRDGRRTLTRTQLIGTDGAHSKVNERFNILKTPVTKGWQVRIRTKNPEDTIRFYPHIGRYAWSIPEDETTIRAGVVCDDKRVFDTFIKRFEGKRISTHHGLLPIHKPFKTTRRRKGGCTARVFGDAAGHIKNTTGGGILPGMEAAQRYATHKSTMPLQAKLYNHFLVHNILQSFSTRQWDAFVAASRSFTKTLEETPRDDITKLMIQLSKNPTYWKMGAAQVIRGKIRFW